MSDFIWLTDDEKRATPTPAARPTTSAALAGTTPPDATPAAAGDEPTDPGSVNPLTDSLAYVMIVDYERAKVERRRLKAMSGAQLRDRESNVELTQADRVGATWEIARRAARRSGMIFPPVGWCRTPDGQPAAGDARDVIEAAEYTNPAGHTVEVERNAATGRTAVTVRHAGPEAAISRPGAFATGELTSGKTLAAVSGWTEYGQIDRSGENREGWHLEALRDALRAREERLQIVDIVASPRTTFLTMLPTGQLVGRFASHDAQEEIPFTLYARGQAGSFILPTHGLNMLKAAAALRPRTKANGPTDLGATTASNMWRAFCMQGEASDRLLRFRTVVDGSGHRIVRGVVSDTYAVYDSAQYVEDIMTSLGGAVEDYRVISYRADETDTRFRLVGGNADSLQRWSDRATNLPINMLKGGNGETGKGSVWLQGGTYTMWCSNTMGSYTKEGMHRRNHTGDVANGIRTSVHGAVVDLHAAGSGLVDAYEQAMTVEAQNLGAWLQAHFEGDLTEGEIARAERIMATNETVNGGGRLLASAVDAVTWMAHEQADLYREDEMERLGARVLVEGLRQVERTGELWMPEA